MYNLHEFGYNISVDRKLKQSFSPVYTDRIGAFMRDLGAIYGPNAQEKIKTVLEHLNGAKRILDLGFGWGMILEAILKKKKFAVGVDETLSLLHPKLKRKLRGHIAVSRAQSLPFSDASFDLVIASEVIHEVEEFYSTKDSLMSMEEIRRVLKPQGRLLILDHLNPVRGSVQFSLPAGQRKNLEKFCRDFKPRKVKIRRLPGGLYQMKRKDFQDFVSKIWSLGTPMERLEMNETHCVFTRQRLEGFIKPFGFRVVHFQPFHSIRTESERHGILLNHSNGWMRKFCAVATQAIGIRHQAIDNRGKYSE